MNPTVVSSACLAGLGLVAAVLALRLGLWTAGTPGPGLFPFITGVLLVVAGADSAVQGAKEARAERIDRGRLLRYAAVIAGFGLAMKPLGSIAATVALLLSVLRGIEKRPWAQSFALALFLAVLFWGLFRYLLRVPLPSGLLGIG